MDREGGLDAALVRWRPWLLVDAAGPFQGADYTTPRACIAAGVHYLDIADGRAFVAGISGLDSEAKRAGVAIISGASTVPALSSAVVDALSTGMEPVTLVEAALTASHRATGGRAVLEAILSYAGRPVEVLQAGRRIARPGWSDLAWRRLAVPGGPALARRLVALCDVPDLELLGDRCPGRPRVVFRAGAEFAVLNLALWAASWLVRLGWMRDLRALAPPVAALQRVTRGLGSDRSGMQVRVVGRVGGCAVERRWTLVAQRGDGPETPSLAAPLLARRLADGGLAEGESTPGARPAVGLLTPAEFEASFAGLAFSTAIERIGLPPPLYARVTGEAFEALPAPVRAMHTLHGAAVAEGRARVERGRNPLARLVATVMRFPPAAAEIPVRVWFSEADGVETWERDFGGRRFRSTLRAPRSSMRDDRLLEERFGPLRFRMALVVHPDGLSMRLRRWSIGPLRLPRWLAPRPSATERAEGGSFHFDVAVSLPLVGLVVRYAGELSDLS